MSGAITVVCPKCKNRMSALPEFIGRKGRCQVCDSLIDIRPAEGEGSIMSIHPARASSDRGRGNNFSPTDVSGWLTGTVGLITTVLAYLVVFRPLMHTSFGRGIAQLFLARGTIPYLSTFVTCWGLAILVTKYWKIKRQLSFVRRELELIPLDVGVQITQRNVDRFIRHLQEVPDFGESILCNRIAGALEHFKSRNNVPEVQQYLATQAEIDASTVDSGYSLLRSFIWANPILGFIGTVVGISFAVAGLSQSFGADAAASVDGNAGTQLVGALDQVTQGLATAFDTTLIGLVFAMVLMFPTEALRKVEYQTLDRIEQFTNESLLRRMSDVDARPDDGVPEVVRAALEGIFTEHQRWLAQWQGQVSELGQAIGADFEAAVGRISSQSAEEEGRRRHQLEQVHSSLKEVCAAAEKSTEVWYRSKDESSNQSRALLDATSHLQSVLAENVRAVEALLVRQAEICRQVAEGSVTAAHFRPAAGLEPTGIYYAATPDGQSTGGGTGMWSRIFGKK